MVSVLPRNRYRQLHLTDVSAQKGHLWACRLSEALSSERALPFLQAGASSLTTGNPAPVQINGCKALMRLIPKLSKEIVQPSLQQIYTGKAPHFAPLCHCWLLLMVCCPHPDLLSSNLGDSRYGTHARLQALLSLCTSALHAASNPKCLLTSQQARSTAVEHASASTLADAAQLSSGAA